MGLLDRIEVSLRSSTPPTAEEFTRAFAGGQVATAQFLARLGADVNWVSTWDGLTPLEAARRSSDEDAERDADARQTDAQFGAVVDWLTSL